jgi:hypothetical protein
VSDPVRRMSLLGFAHRTGVGLTEVALLLLVYIATWGGFG